MNEAQIRALPWEGVIPLAQVLQHALPAYGGDGWNETAKTMLAEPSEAAIVADLAAELRADPDMLFAEPIRLAFTEPEDWDEEDQAEYGDRPIRPRVGNGMHRIVAAMQAGAARIRVILQDLKEAEGPFAGELVQVDYLLAGGTGEDSMDDAWWLRSFRLTPQVWVEAASTGGRGNVVSSIYYCPHRLRDQLVRALAERSSRYGMTFAAIRATATTWDELLEDDDEQG